jgi:Integral peroxisomal membrane peroxin
MLGRTCTHYGSLFLTCPRIGVVFVFQNRILRLLSWRYPTHTVSFLALYSFVCLDPNLLTVLPVAIMLLSVMVPSFIIRHPPPPTNSPTDPYAASGPPLAPPTEVKAVSEMSGDFFRNLRDLQNCMEDFSQVHDKVCSLILPRTNFSNEPLSSTLFLFLFVTCCVLFLASHLLPWRAIFLAAGWFFVIACHPKLQRSLRAAHDEHLLPRERQAQGWLNAWIENDIILDSSPETREVEIFELQKRVWSSSSIGEWEGWVFSSSPYDPLSSTRISGDRPHGTRFFEDVRPPPGWEWADKKWTLDLLSKDWVEERMITGVEVETEGERWVYDIVYAIGEEEALKKGKGKRRDWEEARERGKKGEWRRRRWVRMVKRRVPPKMLQ